MEAFFLKQAQPNNNFLTRLKTHLKQTNANCGAGQSELEYLIRETEKLIKTD